MKPAYDHRFNSFHNSLTEGEDFYMENGYRVMTKAFLTKRGHCCGNGCRHCPYFPKHTKGSKQLLDALGQQ
jgi:hypothetical protein